MTTGIVVLMVAAAALAALLLATIVLLQLRSGRSSALFREQFLELSRRLDDAALKHEGLARMLSEGQVKNLEALQSRFAGAVDTLNRQLGTMTTTMNEQLSQTRGNIGQQLDGTQKVVSQVQERLGELTVTARNIHELGRDIARLQDILQAPKLRGNLGELFLQELLAQVLPSGSYGIQHSFSSGEKVDAVIRLGDRLVPVDSKFPLESFNRILESESEEAKKKGRREFATSVRRRVDEIAGKYIRPAEGTYDFALMYIPAENVYYEVIIRDDSSGENRGIFSYALEKHVIPVSPNSFYAYLMTIAYGLKGLHIEKRAEEIWGQLALLRRGLEKFGDDFQVLGRHLENARSKFGDAESKIARLQDSFRQISGDEDDGADRTAL